MNGYLFLPTWYRSPLQRGPTRQLLGDSGCHGPPSKFQGIPRAATPLCLQRGPTRQRTVGPEVEIAKN